ncbi:MAG TPA: hypothetical protein VHE33_13725 [Acidobacteriaceae bacterium]|nr:hypothetical protein [Acidobacteriaceae bacterium]
MKLQPYLYFKGNCEEAFQLYARVLGGDYQGVFRYGQSPMAGQHGKEWDDKVMHVSMNIGDQTLMGSDAPTSHFRQPQAMPYVCTAPTKRRRSVFTARSPKAAKSICLCRRLSGRSAMPCLRIASARNG